MILLLQASPRDRNVGIVEAKTFNSKDKKKRNNILPEFFHCLLSEQCVSSPDKGLMCMLNFGLIVTAESATDELDGACQALAKRLEVELRRAKHVQLACGEVLLPADLLPKIAKDVLTMAENEPCGLR